MFDYSIIRILRDGIKNRKINAVSMQKIFL